MSNVSPEQAQTLTAEIAAALQQRFPTAPPERLERVGQFLFAQRIRRGEGPLDAAIDRLQNSRPDLFK